MRHRGFQQKLWTQEALSDPSGVCTSLRELPVCEQLGYQAFGPQDPQNNINLHTFPRTDLSKLWPAKEKSCLQHRAYWDWGQSSVSGEGDLGQ